MDETPGYQHALTQIRSKLGSVIERADVSEIAKAKNQVLNRYQKVFNVDAIDKITEDEFRSFLYFENNRHWGGLQRHGTKLCSDMPRLKKALKTLLDEDKPLENRYDEAVNAVNGFGKAVATAILTVVYPEKYGVWNNPSEGGLKANRLWPEFKRGASIGERYTQINAILLRLARDLDVDLWTLDSFWWGLMETEGSEPPPPPPEGGEGGAPEHVFGLEQHLHEFLRDNWDQIELGADWEIYGEPGDEAAGYEYPCDVGFIDILAKHRKGKRWLVIELKRAQTSDNTVGQVLRYMGWVKAHVAEEGDKVEGLIIARDADEKMRYALTTVPDVNFMRYEVRFSLTPSSEASVSDG